MDFPQSYGQIQPPTHLHTYMREMGMMGLRKTAGSLAGPASAAWPANNQAIYMPFRLAYPFPVRRAFWINGSALGNMDVGLYSTDGIQLWAAGSTAQSGASTLQYVTVTPELLLRPGDYYIALANDGTTNRCFGSTVVSATFGRLIGLYQQASAFALPTSATLAQWNSAVWPLCGITRTSSGF